MTYLLDANGLAALVIPQHEHHERAHRFFARRAFAVTATTQLALLQILSRPRRVKEQTLPPLHTAPEALRLTRLVSHRRGVKFLPANLNCAGPMPFAAVTGHRQWNDFYLVALAQKHGLMLATFDEAIPRHFPEVCKLIPWSQQSSGSPAEPRRARLPPSRDRMRRIVPAGASIRCHGLAFSWSWDGVVGDEYRNRRTGQEQAQSTDASGIRAGEINEQWWTGQIHRRAGDPERLRAGQIH